MKKLLMILLVLGVVFISGCTGGGNTGGTSTNGLSITSILVDPSSIEAGETTYLMVDIENVGGEKADGINAQVIGLPSGWVIDTVSNVPNELYPPEGGLKGEIATIEWVLKSPSEQQTEITYPGEVTLDYHYKTHLENLVRVADRNWIRSLPEDQGKTETSKLGTIEPGSQRGPIHATIKMSSSSVYSGTTARVILDIQNVGSGSVSYNGKNDYILVSAQGLSNCDLGEIKLIRGQSRQLRCDIDTSDIDTWKNVRIDVDLEYNYRLRKMFEIIVTPKPL